MTSCKTCGEPFEKDGIPVLCRCEREESKKREREAIREALKVISEGKRKACFRFPAFHEKTFANADDADSKPMLACCEYADSFSEKRKKGLGILLYGAVGTGKTYMAAAIANALCDKRHSVKFTSLSAITDDMNRTFGGKMDIPEALARFDCVVIDDLGVERDTEMMNEQVDTVINTLYEAGTPMIITTNIPLKQMQESNDRRIFTRILERCRPVHVGGVDRRRMKSQENSKQFK